MDWPEDAVHQGDKEAKYPIQGVSMPCDLFPFLGKQSPRLISRLQRMIQMQQLLPTPRRWSGDAGVRHHHGVAQSFVMTGCLFLSPAHAQRGEAGIAQGAPFVEST